jgi:hypothetical protein
MMQAERDGGTKAKSAASPGHGSGRSDKKGAEEQLAPGPVPALGIWSPPAVGTAAGAPVPSGEQQARRSLEDLLPSLVRKIAWSGDARRGTMRLELGAGALSGGTLVVHADDGRVSVQLRAPEGVNAAEWRARIEERLVMRGLSVDAVEVE